MKWNIICDSGCDLFELESKNENITYKSVPFYITIENREFTDDSSLDVSEMVKKMKESKEASSTACPSPQAWQNEMVKGENNNFKKSFRQLCKWRYRSKNNYGRRFLHKRRDG